MHISKFTINIIIFLLYSFTYAQEKKEILKKEKDSVTANKKIHGLRIGFDISKPILGLVKHNYNGLEIVGDYRVSRKWYIATELGYEKNISNEEVINVTSSGSFIRLGANYNAYNNWLDMNNEIYVGGRYGLALFNQKLNSYTPNVNNIYFPSEKVLNGFEMSNLNIHWLEFQTGIKVETFKNLFIGFHGSFKVGLYVKQPESFQSLYAPGFNRILESKTGVGFNYTISYLIPFH